ISAGCGTSDSPSTPAAQTGGLTITISGLPAQVPAVVTVTGPAGLARTVRATETLANLVPGTYAIVAANARTDLTSYLPSPATQSIEIRVGTLASVGITYTMSGGLAITITGLSTQTSADVTVSGPEGFSRTVSATQTLTDLQPGSYAVVATDARGSDGLYVPAPDSQSVTVDGGAVASIAISYSLVVLNFRIEAVHLTQGIQTLEGAVPLVAGRDAYVRVFVTANRRSRAAPPVRVRLYRAGALTGTIMIPTPLGLVPLAVKEGVASSSWNAAIPGSLIQADLAVLADVDPENATPEEDETDNQFPRSGAPHPLETRVVPVLNLRLVPILLRVNERTGDVNAQNQGDYLSLVRKISPIPAVDAEVRTAFQTSVDVPNQQEVGWEVLLSELAALRVADGSSAYYYGVVDARSSGWFVAGIAELPGWSALGWDDPITRADVAAHELGHNWGRFHAPCGNPDGTDPSYPWEGGIIGAYGFDLVTGMVIDRRYRDFMTYCYPKWISVYNYLGILNYLTSPEVSSVLTAAGPTSYQPTLLVWGRVSSRGLELEPALAMVTRPSLPTRAGPYQLQGLDAAGAQLFTISFSGEAVAHARDLEARHFAFALPLAPAALARLATLRLSDRRRQRSITGTSPMGVGPAQPAAVRVQSLGGGRVRLGWDATAYPMVMVRDGTTAEVLAFARGGSVILRTQNPELELSLSNGVRTSVRRFPIPRE
ncbi:MAG: hypothetical protein ACT4PM_09925, partial [Gemmatimonadales bacterium]